MPRPPATTLLTIGQVAEATGLSPDTLRVWERRYGLPVPHRLPSGHRRYSVEMLPRLRAMAEAMADGGRPGALWRGLAMPAPHRALREAVEHMDLDAFLRAFDLPEVLDLEAVRRLETAVGELERAERLGELAPEAAAWAEEACFEVLARGLPPSGEARTLVMPAGPGGRFSGLRARLVGASFNVQRLPALALQQPWKPEGAAALAVAMGARRVALSVPLSGQVALCRQAVLDLRAALPDRVALSVCGPGPRRGLCREGIDAHCGVRVHAS